MASLATRSAPAVAAFSAAVRKDASSQSQPVCMSLASSATTFSAVAVSSSVSPFFQGARVPAVRAARPGPAAAAGSSVVQVRAAEVYEVELDRPYGIKFYRGEDRAIYIDSLAAGQSAAKSGVIQEGDRVLATSAVFGNEMWPAAEYGRVMYTVRNRIGTLLIRLEKNNGVKVPAWTKKDKYLEERAAGNYGDAIREKQLENFARKKELESQREDELEAGLKLYKAGQYSEALQRFQSIIGLEPSYREEAVAFYNIACCCGKLKQLEQGLEALEAAMEAGFDDYKKIRQDPDLAFLRNSDEFDDLLSKYDEPFINENAIKALTSVFSFFGKK